MTALVTSFDGLFVIYAALHRSWKHEGFTAMLFLHVMFLVSCNQHELHGQRILKITKECANVCHRYFGVVQN